MVDWKNRIVETADMAVKDLKANPKNWRKHPQAQQNALAGVLDTVGWVQQVIWNRQTGHLVDGHLRVELAAKRKEKTIPVNVVDLSPDEEAMILATFDPIAAMAEADRQQLAALMQSVESENEAVRELLASIAKEEKIDLGGEPAPASEPQVDRAAELREQWQTAPGQLWQLGDHRVLCGDSTNAADVARLMGGETADLVLTDPPYGISVVSGKAKGTATPNSPLRFAGKIGDKPTTFGKIGGENIVQSKVYAAVAGDESTDAARDALALTEDAKNRIVFGGNYFTDFLPPSRCWIVWDKENTGNFADAELAWTSFDKGVKLYRWMWNGLARKGDRKTEGVTRAHPTQKPVGLFAAILNDYSKPGEIVLDPFLGSGTTLIACEQLGRRCFGMEISPEYVAVILQRWHDMTGRDPTLLET